MDYDWAVNVIKKNDLAGRVKLLFSPVWGELEMQDLAQWILKDQLNVRLQIQLHKMIWSPETKGV